MHLISDSALLSNVQRKQIAHASCAACFNIHQQTDLVPRFNTVKTYAANPLNTTCIKIPTNQCLKHCATPVQCTCAMDHALGTC
jgi:hypothetical protein